MMSNFSKFSLISLISIVCLYISYTFYNYINFLENEVIFAKYQTRTANCKFKDYIFRSKEHLDIAIETAQSFDQDLSGVLFIKASMNKTGILQPMQFISTEARFDIVTISQEEDNHSKQIFRRVVKENYSHEFKLKIDAIFGDINRELIGKDIIVRSLCVSSSPNSIYSWHKAVSDIIRSDHAGTITIYLAIRKIANNQWVNIGLLDPNLFKNMANPKF